MSESVNIRQLNELVASKSDFISMVTHGMDQTIVGQKHLVESLLIAMLANGHVLLEGVPGLAKTLAIKTLAQLIDAKYSRIQFTPDLLPGDVIGTMIYSVKSETFQVKKGPIFANFVLADEINRAPAKVQSALLEAMQERQVTIGDSTFPLDKPFLVMATQNPVEQEGTYPLPEAQVDRFLMKVVIGYPSKDEEREIIRMNIAREQRPVHAILRPEEVIEAQKVVEQIYPKEYGLDDLASYISFGASPRASISLAKAARAYAFLHQRGYVIPEDVISVCHDVLRHRIGLTYEAEANNFTTDMIITDILDKVQVP